MEAKITMRIMLIQTRGLINGAGGCEKVLANLANYFASIGHKVIIATNDNVKGELFFDTNNIEFHNIYDPNNKKIEKIRVEKYRGKNLLKKIQYRTRKIKAQIINLIKIGCKTPEMVYKHNLLQDSNNWKKFIEERKPDLIITLSINCALEVTYNQDYNIPIIDSCNGRPDYDYTDILWYRPQYYMDLLKETFSRLAGIQILFKNYEEFIPDTFNGKCVVIPNVVPQFSMEERIHHYEKRNGKIVMVGRLDDGKNQILAIKAFAKIAKKYPNWSLNFYGDGDLREYLANTIKEQKMENHIFLHGKTKDVLQKLKESDIFVFPSKFEGFPLALTEAMSIGLPCIGLKTCSGVNQLISDGKNGFLVNNETEFSKKIEELINNCNLRNELGENANNSMKQYNQADVYNQWKNFVEKFEKCCKNS